MGPTYTVTNASSSESDQLFVSAPGMPLVGNVDYLCAAHSFLSPGSSAALDSLPSTVRPSPHPPPPRCTWGHLSAAFPPRKTGCSHLGFHPPALEHRSLSSLCLSCASFSPPSLSLPHFSYPSPSLSLEPESSIVGGHRCCCLPDPV